MICPNCSKNHRRKDGQRCSCGYVFNFDPEQTNGWTDNKFKSMLALLSQNGTAWYTKNQCFTRYCVMQNRSLDQKIFRTCVGGITVCILIIAYLFISKPSVSGNILVTLGVIALAFLVYYFFATGSPLNSSSLNLEFEKLWSKWSANGGEFKNLIDTPALATAPPEWREEDIYDYGVERILIVQKRIYVDLFVRNGFHTLQKMLIVCMDGYPSYMGERLQKIVDAKPDIDVFILHDSTAEGVSMLSNQSQWSVKLGANANIHDLGIFPENIQYFSSLTYLEPKKRNNEFALDCISYARLSAILSDAIAYKVSITQAVTDSTYRRRGGDYG